MSAEHRIELRPGYVFVWQRGSMESLEEARAFQQEIEAALRNHGVRKALMDNRETDLPDEEMRTFMNTWSENREHFDALAIVVESTMVKVRSTMEAIAHGAMRRAFNSIEEAETWLLSR